jgi:hypothetical protein
MRIYHVAREFPRTSYKIFSGPRGPKSYLTVRRSAIVPDAVKSSDAVKASGSSSPGAEASNDSAQPRRGLPATVCLIASVDKANRQQHQMVLYLGIVWQRLFDLIAFPCAYAYHILVSDSK